MPVVNKGNEFSLWVVNAIWEILIYKFELPLKKVFKYCQYVIMNNYAHFIDERYVDSLLMSVMSELFFNTSNVLKL